MLFYKKNNASRRWSRLAFLIVTWWSCPLLEMYIDSFKGHAVFRSRRPITSLAPVRATEQMRLIDMASRGSP